MRYLSKKYDRPSDRADGIAKWLEHTEENAKETSTTWAYFAIATLAATLLRFFSDALGKTGIADVLTVMVFVGTALTVAGYVLEQRRVKQSRMEDSRSKDPLRARAETILRGIENFKAHCDKYRDFFDSVDQGVREPDDALAERYYEFIANAHDALERAITDFENIQALAIRRKQYLERHPGAANPMDSSLSDICAQLGQPIRVPPEFVTSDCEATLEYEQTLAGLCEEREESIRTGRLQAASKGGA